MANSLTSNEQQAPAPKPVHKCGESGKYGQLKNKGRAQDPETGVKFERDHIPSKAALLKRAETMDPTVSTDSELKKCVKGKVTYRGFAIVIPKKSHRGYSPTCGGKNTSTQISYDASSDEKMKEAAKRDTEAMEGHLKDSDCEEAYKKAAEEARNQDADSMIQDAIKECKKALG